MNEGPDILTAISVVALLLIIVGITSYWTGHDSGVKDHADGKYVVVELPDGTRVVVQVKKKEKP